MIFRRILSSSVMIGMLSSALGASAQQLESVEEYAPDCMRKIGLSAIPGYKCEDGTPLGRAGLEIESDNNFFGRVPTGNPNVDAVFLCRDRNQASGTTGLNGYILQNRITGATCFFDAHRNGSDEVPGPSVGNAGQFWADPENMAGSCQECHSNDPFIASPGIAPAFKAEGMRRHDRNLRGPYDIVRSDLSASVSHFSGWNAETRRTAGGCANGCHSASSNGLYGGLLSSMLAAGLMPPVGASAYVPDVDRSSRAQLGVFRPSTGTWVLGVADDSSAPLYTEEVRLGAAGDKPVVLRNAECSVGARSAELAVQRGAAWSTRHVLRDEPDRSFTFGSSSAEAAAAWNGVPVSFASGQFVTDLNNDRASANDPVFSFGTTNDTPLIGRWGIGTSHRVGVFRRGTFFLDSNATNAYESADESFVFGASTDLAFAADFDGDGLDEIGVFRNGAWKIDLNRNRAFDGSAGGDLEYQFGRAGDVPVVGRWSCADGLSSRGIALLAATL